jgi:hypothetical protein
MAGMAIDPSGNRGPNRRARWTRRRIFMTAWLLGAVMAYVGAAATSDTTTQFAFVALGSVLALAFWVAHRWPNKLI